jgi:putative endonuclease
VSLASGVFGRKGEELAAQFLTQQGYRIVQHNYRTVRGEIDLIAYDGPTLVFVEVKARRGNAFGEPHWSIDRRKQIRMSRLASYYLHRHRLKEQACRFDLVFIQADRGQAPVIQLLQNAFEVQGGRL